MYAVIETGGKQYRVELGTELAVERLDAMPGTTINIDRVLLVADGDNASVGTPTVADALVTADVVRQDRGDKVVVFKYRPKARHRSKKGHRQEQTVLRVADIRFNGRSAADEQGTQKSDKKAERAAAAQAAEKKAAADQALAAKLAADAKTKAEPKATDEPAKPARRRPSTPKAEAAPSETADASAATADDATPATATAATANPETTAEETATQTESKPKTTKPRATRSSTKKDE